MAEWRRYLSAGSNPLCSAGGGYDGNGVTIARPPILVVLVLYQIEASRSLTLVSFFQALNASGLASQFRLLIYDNSPSQSAVPDTPPIPFSCIHDPANGGLVAAYNAALNMAEKEGNEWLLLLDQDTVIDPDYLTTLWRSLRELAGNRRCAALAPKLVAENKIISPARVLWGGRLSPVDKTLGGIAPWEIVALNSGTLLRISAVREMGGFNPEFWLDYLDHWLFNRLHRAGYLVHVLDAELPHELSVRSMGSMPVARYKNILLAESQFYRCCKSPIENLIYDFRLLMRAIKMFVLPGRRRLFSPTLATLVRHLRLNRSTLAVRAEK
jgi:GT2 family glycosyltransferase